MISYPCIYMEYLCLSNNPINEIGAFYIHNYLETCNILPHRINLYNTNIKNKGIKSIIKGMIKRKNINDKMLIISLKELEYKLKLLNEITNNITYGMAIDENDKNKLFVPISIIVNNTIDCENLGGWEYGNKFICTGADYKYIGHGQCNENYCAVTATICTEKQYNNDIKTLPLIHLFMKQCKYLSLVLNEESLKYLLCTQWGMNYSAKKCNDNVIISEKLVNELYDFCYYLRSLHNLNNIDKWNRLLNKIFETAKLNVDKLKVNYLANLLLQKCNDSKKNEMTLKEYHREIKKYIVQNKRVPFTVNKWKGIIKTNIKCNDSKKVNLLAKYAADLIQTQWNIKQELTNIMSSHYIKCILLSKNEMRKQTKTVMEFILKNCRKQLFGLKCLATNNMQLECAVFCVEKEIINKYKLENKYNDILDRCIEEEILYEIDNTMQIVNEDIMFVNHKKSKDMNGIQILELHRKLFDTFSKNKWSRSFFDEHFNGEQVQ